MSHEHHRKTVPQRIALLLAAMLAMPAVAADRALLVGVGNFQGAPRLALAGIDVDLATMSTVANRLGFTPPEIRVLHNAEATLAAVKSGLGQWVRDGVGPDDQVLVYLSTHGTQVPDRNGDESDGVDEALLLHDPTLAVGPDGQETLSNVLLDDDLDQALAAIPSRNILVVIDACHSGTATRDVRLRSLQSGSDRAQAKFYAYPGKPKAAIRGFTPVAADAPINYVSLSAAADDEQSLALPEGSLFTRGVARTIDRAIVRGAPLTPKTVRDEATRFIADTLGAADQARVFHPQLGGNPALADKPLRLIAATAGQGPVWTSLSALAGTLAPLPIQANRRQFREGEPLELIIDVARDGYLNVVGIDPNDTAIVAFPNGYDADNRVRAGQVRLPGVRPFELPAAPPAGPTLLVAFFTERPLNLFENAEGRRDPKGNLLEAFPQLSQAGLVRMRGFQPTARVQTGAAQTVAAGTLEVTICPPAGCL